MTRSTPALTLVALGLALLFIASCLLVRPAFAQDLVVTPPAEQTQPILFRNATVYPIASDPIEDGAVLINDGRIAFVGPDAQFDLADIPADCRVVDATGKRIYPGLVAATTQIGLVETSAVRATRDENETGAFTPEVRAAVAINPDSTLIPVTRLGGVLVAGVLPTGGRVSGQAAAVKLMGWTSEDMTIDDHAALVVAWPQVRPLHRWYVIDTPQDQYREIELNLQQIDDFFDAAEAYCHRLERHEDQPTADAPKADVRLAATRPFVSGEPDARKPLFLAANDLDQINDALTWALDRGYDPVLLGGRDAEMSSALLAEHDIPVILSGVHRFPKRADSSYAEAFNQPARLAAKGVRFAITSSDRDGNVRNLPHEAALARRHGLSEADTLRAITLTPAQILGIDDRYGSLEPGKSATLIVTDGDVLEVTTVVEAAYIDGRPVPMTSKQTELRDKYREKYRQLGIIDD